MAWGVWVRPYTTQKRDLTVDYLFHYGAASADIPTSIRLDLLEHELQRKLHLARSPRRKDMVECRRTDVAVRQKEVRAVQDVKQLRAELELLRFGHFEILKGGEVPVGIPRTDIHVAAFRAKLSRVGCGIKSL